MDNNINLESILQNLTELYFDRKYKNICSILKIEHNLNYVGDELTYKYNKSESGMIFYNNENPMIYTRVYIDKETKYILNTLLMVTSSSINEKEMLDLIINKWLKTIHLINMLDEESIPKIIGKESYIQVKVSKKCWDDMLRVCKNKGISVKVGFKLAITDYLNEIIL